MILPFLLALLAFLALMPIISPLLRGSRPVPSRASFDQAVYRDQLQELDRDIARGVLSPSEAGAARLEIQRRLLAADQMPLKPARLTRSPVLAVVVFVLGAGGSVGTYLWLGQPNLPDDPYAGRKAELAADNGSSSLQQAADTLAAKLKQNPSDGPGWLLYARSLAMLREWDQSEAAYRHALGLGQKGPDVEGDYGEVLVMRAGGTVSPEAESVFHSVLKQEPGSGLARYYLALAAMQAGESQKAIDGFQGLLAGLPEDSPLRDQIGQKIAEAAQQGGLPVPKLAQGTATPRPPAPDANAVANAANMSDAQRQAMIQGMVAKLAAKQQADPSDLDGWLRLGRAYAVLHEDDKAADAYEQAAKLRPDDVSIPLQEVRALLSDHGPTDKLPPKVIGLLKQVEAKDPDQPLVLWYLGMAAAQDQDRDGARHYWGKLLTKIPPGGDDARMIQAALDALNNPKDGPGR